MTKQPMITMASTTALILFLIREPGVFRITLRQAGKFHGGTSRRFFVLTVFDFRQKYKECL